MDKFFLLSGVASLAKMLAMLTPLPVQTTYAQYINAGQVGMPATTTGWDVDTGITEDPSGNGIGFGLAVSQGTLHGDRSTCLGTLSGRPFKGITRADPTLPALAIGPDRYHDGDNMAVHVRGDLWVTPHVAVVAGDPVYFNGTTGVLGNSNLTSGVAVDDARWMTSAAAGHPAVVRLGVATGNSDAG